MKITIKRVPDADELREYAASCSELCEIRVLVYLLGTSGETDTEELCSALDLTQNEAASAVAYWRGAGLVTAGGPGAKKKRGGADTVPLSKDEKEIGETAPASTDKAGKRQGEAPAESSGEGAKNVVSSSGTDKGTEEPGGKVLPSMRENNTRVYTGEELARLISENTELKSLIGYAEKTLGKVFSPSDIAMLVNLVDYVLLSPVMIMRIVEYCAENDKKSMRYVEKVAISLYDEGVCDYEKLEAYLEKKRASAKNEAKVRRITGIVGRAFTSREKAYIDRWFGEFGSAEELITLAFEKTVDNIAKPSFAYMTKLLESWHRDGIRTAADVEKQKNAGSVRSGKNGRACVDLDDFDEVASAMRKNADENGGEGTGVHCDLDDFFEGP